VGVRDSPSSSFVGVFVCACILLIADIVSHIKFYQQKAHSVTPALINFLTAISLVNNGVREILPFIRYISQFIDFEFATIQKQDRGDGVVCAATWYVMVI